MVTKILFVCMGNVCRSPTAEAVFRAQILNAGLDQYVEIDSAGTHAYHIGESPDPRARNAAKKRGYDLSELRARQIKGEDFQSYDLILAMDWDNLALLQQKCPKPYQHKLQLLMRFAVDHEEATVPDPYYGGEDGFEQVLNYVEDSCTGLLDYIRKRATMYVAAA